MTPVGPRSGEPARELLGGLAARWGELTPYRVAGAGATYLRGEALLYVVPPLRSGPPWEYLVDEETLDDLLQADDTYLVLVGSGADDIWTVPADEAAFLIEGRVPQTGPQGERAWRYYLAPQAGLLDSAQAKRWLLRAESNPKETVDVSLFRNAPPGG
ncbi:MAG: hypothetical protein HY330_06180 [Chloroflexi bacterium]|nr:hypothetical protein [Chloroflexota bacterium]